MRSLLALVLLLAAACGGDDDATARPDARAATPDAGPARVTITTYLRSVQAEMDFLAVQDGEGAWQALSGPGGVYEFDVTTGKYATLWVCVVGDNVELGMIAHHGGR